MIEPGETFIGLDLENRLWVVPSAVTGDQEVAIANLTSHGRPSQTNHRRCDVISHGEHPYPKGDSCMYWHKATLNPIRGMEEAKRQSQARQHDPFAPELLLRIQLAALVARQVPADMKNAIRATLEGGI